MIGRPSSPEIVAVQKLTAKMKYKMRRRKHSHTNHWHDMTLNDLIACVSRELWELNMAAVALKREEDCYARWMIFDDKRIIRAKRRVINECADVANYCAFIVDNLTR